MAEGRDSADRAMKADGEPMSPWAGEVPITHAPVEFSWTEPADPIDTVDSSSEAETQGTAAHHIEGSGIDTAGRVGRRRPALVAAGAAAALVCVVGVLSVTGGGDDPASGETAATTPVTEPPADSLPSADTETTVETDTTEQADDDGDVEETATPVGSSENDDPDDVPTRLDVAEGTWSKVVIDVPPALSTLEPTTVIAVSNDAYHEIELPSGTVQSIGLGAVARNSQLVIGGTSTLLASFSRSSSGTVILRPGVVPVEVDLPENRNDVASIPSTDEFVTFTFEGAVGEFEQLTVSSTGEISSKVTDLGPVAPWLRTRAPNGREVVTDGGGVFERRADGTTVQISDGVLISTSSHHLLVRECTEDYVCTFVTIDGATGDRQIVLLDPEMNPQLSGASIQVSPDGQFVRSLRFTQNGVEEVITDLSTGASSNGLSNAFGNEQLWTWTAGSEGLVGSANSGGLTFVDRSTGELVDFGSELGLVVQVGTRLGIALPKPVPPSALATGVELIGLSASGDIVEIDVDVNSIVTTESPPLASGAPARVFPDADGAVIVSYDNVPSIRFNAAEGTARLTSSSRPGGPLIDGPSAGSVWEGSQAGLVLVDALGRELGPAVAGVDRSSLIGGDGAGDVLFASELGGVFLAGAERKPQRLTTGEVLAVNATVAYVRECDEQLDCGTFKVDRQSGERQAVNDGLLDRTEAMSPVVWSGSGVSPDGNVVVALSRDGQGDTTGTVIVDHTSGTTLSLRPLELSTPIIWSDDSDFAVFLADNELQVFDRAANQVQLLPDAPQMKTIAAVPPNVAEITPPVIETSPDLSTGNDDVNAATGVVAVLPTAPESTRSTTLDPDEAGIASAADSRALVVGPARFPF